MFDVLKAQEKETGYEKDLPNCPSFLGFRRAGPITNMMDAKNL
jgi:hypothetical protein